MNQSNFLQDKKVLSVYQNFSNKGQTSAYKNVAKLINQEIGLPVNQQLLIESLIDQGQFYLGENYKLSG